MLEVDPLVYSNESPGARPSPFQPPPRKWRRPDKADVTEAAATALITGGRLTPRDIDLLRAAWMYGAMTTAQITRLVFHPLQGGSARRVASRRLNFLYNEHCLDRAFRGLGRDFVYTLDLQGARILQMEQQKASRKDLKWSPRAVGERLLLLEHTLGITEFGVSLTHAARTWPGGGELRWFGEHVLVLTTPAGAQFNPDGLGMLRLAETGLAFFLEWDRGTETVPVVSSKVKTYLDYMRSPEWRAEFTRFPAVLIATTTFDRAEKLLIDAHRRLKALLAAEERLTVLITTHEQLTAQGGLGPVWFQVGATSKDDFHWRKGRALIDLMPAAAG